MLRTLLMVGLLWLAAPAWAEARDPGSHFFQQTLGDFPDDLTTARSEGKLGVLLMFEMDDCPFCHRMKQAVLSQPEVQDYFRKHFLIFSVDVEGATPMTDFDGKETTTRQFSLAQRVRATPVFMVFNLDGKPVARFTGATKDSAEFLLFGRYLVEGGYRDNTPFARYKQQAGKQ